MRAGSTLVAVLAAFFALSGLASAAQHERGATEPIPWDPAKVADLAERLSKHSEELRQAVRKQVASDSIASGQSRASERLMDRLRGLRVECNRLKKAAEAGKSRDDTRNIFRRIDQIHRDAAEELRRMFLSEENLDRVKRGRAMLEELRLYYTGKPDLRPDLVGPKRGEGANPAE